MVKSFLLLFFKKEALAWFPLFLAGCAVQPVGPVSLSKIEFSALPGWGADHPSQAMPALLASCARLDALPADQSVGGSGDAAARGGQAGQWRPACHDASQVPAGDDAAARAFIEHDLVPWRISQGDSSQALFTGYFEPEVSGSRVRSAADQTPLYARPADLVQADLGDFKPDLTGTRIAGRVEDGRLRPYFDRAQIVGGALSRRRLEIAWLADPVDAFFLQIQGAGRIRLADGRIMRVGYAGQNGRPYVAIGKLLADRGELPLDGISMQSIRAWLAAHPADAAGVMDGNPSYVFFHELPGLRADDGPPGALGVSLVPGRSVAIDRAFVPLGAPIWVDTTDPLDGGAFQRLMSAQDIGGAIKGPLRADIFYGWGADAEARAGKARQAGEMFVLLPAGGA
jgi:membrane-bound lytic murein transglycosylase A